MQLRKSNESHTSVQASFLALRHSKAAGGRVRLSLEEGFLKWDY